MKASQKDQNSKITQSKLKLAVANKTVQKIVSDYAQAIDEARLKKINKDLK